MSCQVNKQTMTITCTQGDTFETPLHMYVGKGANKEPYIPSQGDTIRIAIKSDYSDAEPIIKKIIPNDTLIVRIQAEETKRLKARKKPYVYDIQLVTPDNTTITFLPQCLWYSTEEVD